jgi:hypothetical protein
MTLSEGRHILGRSLGALMVLCTVVCLAPAEASAGLAPGLCHSNTSRGSIPSSFAVKACFDGTALYIYNNLDVALGVAFTGSVGSPRRTESNFDLASIATRRAL